MYIEKDKISMPLKWLYSFMLGYHGVYRPRPLKVRISFEDECYLSMLLEVLYNGAK